MWKTLAGHCIYQTSTGTKVVQNPLFRWLEFNNSNALQTVLNRYRPEKPGLHYIKPLILAAELQPGSTCMLGLGGAGAAHALSPFLRSSQLTVIESNAEVIDLAARFFKVGNIANLTIIHQDANLYLQECRSQFQHLLVDLFDPV